MSARLHLVPTLHLQEPGAKRTFNRALFTIVAPKYDVVTRALSFGRDAAWKRHLVAGLPDLAAPRCLDLACGTGDLTRAVAARYPRGTITGLDLTPAMLDLARKSAAGGRIDFIEGSMESLPCADASIDVVTGGYALRNAPDLTRAIDEVYRALAPGGVAAFLDFSRPESAAGSAITVSLLKIWGAFWGVLLHRNADVYGYIAESLRRYPHRAELRAMLLARGFRLRDSRLHMGGILESIWIEKPVS